MPRITVVCIFGASILCEETIIAFQFPMQSFRNSERCRCYRSGLCSLQTHDWCTTSSEILNSPHTLTLYMLTIAEGERIPLKLRSDFHSDTTIGEVEGSCGHLLAQTGQPVCNFTYKDTLCAIMGCLIGYALRVQIRRSIGGSYMSAPKVLINNLLCHPAFIVWVKSLRNL